MKHSSEGVGQRRGFNCPNCLGGHVLPCRVYVPSSWDGAEKFPRCVCPCQKTVKVPPRERARKAPRASSGTKSHHKPTGRRPGRPAAIVPEEVLVRALAMRAEGATWRELAEVLGYRHETLYYRLKTQRVSKPRKDYR